MKNAIFAFVMALVTTLLILVLWVTPAHLRTSGLDLVGMGAISLVILFLIVFLALRKIKFRFRPGKTTTRVMRLLYPVFYGLLAFIFWMERARHPSFFYIFAISAALFAVLAVVGEYGDRKKW